MYRGLPQARAFKAKAACCSACFLLTVLPAIASAGSYSGGSGTEAEPYRISTVLDWKKLMATPADWGAHFILTADIDLDGVFLTPIAPDTSTDPFFQGTPFTGVFDGNHYVIRNALVNRSRSDFVGLFGCLGSGGQIKNLGAEDTVIAGRWHVGGLAGNNYGSITNCYSIGAVIATGDYVGGLAGYNYASIINCYSAGVVAEAGDLVGGLAGFNDGTMSNCYSSSLVDGDRHVGGLVGWNHEGTISNCCSSGSVTGTGYYGRVVGGLVGENYSGTIINCYSTGSASGTGDYVGGLLGSNGIGGAVSDCYSTGSVDGTGSYLGGLVGRNLGVVSSSLWDLNSSGWTTSAGGTPKTTAEMKTQGTFTSAGWDFVGEGVNGPNDVWTIDEGEDYPRFVWEVVRGFTGDEVDFGDYCLLAGHWRREDCESLDDCGGVDIDFSGAIDFTDLRVVTQRWLSRME